MYGNDCCIPTCRYTTFMYLNKRNPAPSQSVPYPESKLGGRRMYTLHILFIESTRVDDRSARMNCWYAYVLSYNFQIFKINVIHLHLNSLPFNVRSRRIYTLQSLSNKYKCIYDPSSCGNAFQTIFPCRKCVVCYDQTQRLCLGH